MITPFEVYLVMQLDSVSCALGVLGVGGLVFAAILTLFNGLSQHNANSFPSLCNMDERKAAWAQRAATRKKVLLFAIPVFLINSLIPSSKTAAAMIILPALTSKEVTEPLAAEGKELYALAKQALRDAVDAAPETMPAKDKK